MSGFGILDNGSPKASRIRRQRGYQWEDTIVKRFAGADGWQAFRLGSPSVALPDVLAVNTKRRALMVIEAKSGTSMSLVVPADQIERCLHWTRTFDIYRRRQVILAFKFLSKKRIATDQYSHRKLHEFFKIWDDSLEVTDCVCTYEGVMYAKTVDGRVELSLKDARDPLRVS